MEQRPRLVNRQPIWDCVDARTVQRLQARFEKDMESAVTEEQQQQPIEEGDTEDDE